MLIKGSLVIGSKVITLRDGKEIENIDDIIYDPLDNRVMALLVDSGGLFSDPKVILLEDTQSIGENAVIIDSEKALKNASEVSQSVADIAKGNTYLTQKKIVTEEGNELGTVTDIYFDPHTGKVEEFEVSQGLEDVRSGKKRVKISDVVTVGQDTTIVKEDIREEFKRQSESQGIRGAVTAGFAKAQEKTPQLVEQTQSKLDQWGQELKQMTEGTINQLEELKDKAQDVRQRTTSQVDRQEIEDKAREAFKNVQDEIEEIKKKVQGGVSKLGERAKDELKEDAVGKYITKNILLPDDKILIRRGEIVTYRVIKEAENKGILDQILRNLSNDPVKKK